MKSFVKRLGATRKEGDPERSKHDERLLECVVANDTHKLRTLIDKKKYTSLLIADEEGRVPMLEACKRGHKECLEILLSAEPEGMPADEQGRTPIHMAALNNHTECITVLTKKGISVDLQDDRKQTAVHYAAGLGQVEMLQALIAYQANLECCDVDGNTPLLIATKSKQVDCVGALLNASANINAANKQKKTALMYACQYGNEPLTRTLLLRGANPSLCDVDGATAAELALSHGHNACAALLRVDVKESPARRKSAMSSMSQASVQEHFSLLSDIPENALATELEKEKARNKAAEEEIATLKAQLSLFNDSTTANGDEDEVDFGDADVDLGTDLTDQTDMAKVAKQNEDLEKQMEKLRTENKSLQAKLDAAEKARQAAEKELAAVKDAHSQLENLENMNGHSNSVSMEEHKKLIAVYRHHLVLSVKGELPDSVKEALLTIPTSSTTPNGTLL
eukprot:m.227898 g.227898  ORF g.227898 m.227898 type:complete len:452 (-) comp22378_c1_seq6:171-1526(-)